VCWREKLKFVLEGEIRGVCVGGRH
jgi:hypothetical protein